MAGCVCSQNSGLINNRDGGTNDRSDESSDQRLECRSIEMDVVPTGFINNFYKTKMVLLGRKRTTTTDYSVIMHGTVVDPTRAF